MPDSPTAGRNAEQAAGRPVGRRERKKAATRQAIADAALELFLERGFEDVSVRDIAEKADVSTTTLFAHFPSKEALVFDREEDVDAQLRAAVRERPEGQSVLEALRAHALKSWIPIATDPRRERFTALVDGTPALREYGERMWMRHADTLGAAIAEELGRAKGDLACAALARFVLEVPTLTGSREDPRAGVDTVFDLLLNGWQEERG